ncbi:hypothetical protein [Methyloversatilis sp.]|nr:hypothetical protein [Methyloversatilis sp.]
MIWSGITLAPSFLVINVYTNEPFSKDFAANWPVLSNWLENEPLVMTLIATAWIPILETLRNVVTERIRREPTGWKDASNIMHAALNTVVSAKLRRFRDAYSGFYLKQRGTSLATAQAAPAICCKEVFKKITEPLKQTESLVSAIYSFFDHAARGDKDQPMQALVSLVRVEDGKAVELVQHLPETAVFTHDVIEKLNTPHSALMHCIKTKKIFVVPSVLNEAAGHNPRYILLGDDSDSVDGSLICYPVPTIRKNVVLVVSVFYPRKKAFIERHKREYESILKMFALRLELEFTLENLKGLCQ